LLAGGGGGVDGLVGEVVESTGGDDGVAWGGEGAREGVVVQVSLDFPSASAWIIGVKVGMSGWVKE
jgi:hypothetical protein